LTEDPLLAYTRTSDGFFCGVVNDDDRHMGVLAEEHIQRRKYLLHDGRVVFVSIEEAPQWVKYEQVRPELVNKFEQVFKFRVFGEQFHACPVGDDDVACTGKALLYSLD